MGSSTSICSGASSARSRTPLFFYVVFEPGGKHAVDTLVLTAATYAFLRCDSERAIRPALALGALGGWSLSIRWANGAFFLALGVALLLRRRRRLVELRTGAMAAVAVVILVLPAFRGIQYFFPIISQPTNGALVRVAASAGGLAAVVQPIDDSDPQGFFDPTHPRQDALQRPPRALSVESSTICGQWGATGDCDLLSPPTTIISQYSDFLAQPCGSSGVF